MCPMGVADWLRCTVEGDCVSMKVAQLSLEKNVIDELFSVQLLICAQFFVIYKPRFYKKFGF